ncbi:hypothetical protein Sez_1401 [Streptococcus equi subsp. zooepidemicus MGCS10565]|uniref:Uncharacterized protein n=1 Tax=Streptococcus equi subsp. zooepidemicus (strain MGCS10565) TaxID=552526 RepID=B4U420_STREM|nr:hypothetical protein Sez_1401 [Streptococcus equi subsp. zooepidemicus MGCS10565]AEJ25687.1 conserved hypothetical protein [Streptococcus equi subsp. zooepidemicus ATCC 35246]
MTLKLALCAFFCLFQVELNAYQLPVGRGCSSLDLLNDIEHDVIRQKRLG